MVCVRVLCLERYAGLQCIAPFTEAFRVTSVYKKKENCFQV